MTDLSSSAAQSAHYRSVRARLSGFASQPAIKRPAPPPRVRDYIFVQIDPLFASPTSLKLQWRDIVAQVCAKHKISMMDLIGGTRGYRAVYARHEAMYRLRHETPMSFPEIGRRLGGKDHTTVMHGVAKHAERMAQG